jgi:hypothetical protein
VVCGCVQHVPVLRPKSANSALLRVLAEIHNIEDWALTSFFDYEN